MNFTHAALAKVDVADRERLVHQENFRVDMNGHGEGQADQHTARIGFDRLVNEIADFGEFLDGRVPGVNFGAVQAQNGRVEIYVIAAGKLGVKAGAQLEQGGDTPDWSYSALFGPSMLKFYLATALEH